MDPHADQICAICDMTRDRGGRDTKRNHATSFGLLMYDVCGLRPALISRFHTVDQMADRVKHMVRSSDAATEQHMWSADGAPLCTCFQCPCCSRILSSRSANNHMEAALYAIYNLLDEQSRRRFKAVRQRADLPARRAMREMLLMQLHIHNKPEPGAPFWCGHPPMGEEEAAQQEACATFLRRKWQEAAAEVVVVTNTTTTSSIGAVRRAVPASSEVPNLVESMHKKKKAPEPPVAPTPPPIMSWAASIDHVYAAFEIHDDAQLPQLNFPVLCPLEYVAYVCKDLQTNNIFIMFKWSNQGRPTLLLPLNMRQIPLSEIKRVIVDGVGNIIVQTLL
ncbi:hypothetical protein HXX76_014095 [Chlamydomonas incerta]|uniref:Uncharacterized protein n=1 Tax=Chlamydomonas incerta TaxID=51695 RepID=A0A835SHG3_CHLIN|nr:hypothetical protein HXX76_014095 [Chlamydomonas incerta]|eukprot:KAG2424937.1 hypothetical protein HXX76_014095 [Chlamydomonas incerta]